MWVMLIFSLQEETGVLTSLLPFLSKFLKKPVFCLESDWFFAFLSLRFSRWHSKTSMKVNCSTHCSFTALNSYTYLQTAFCLFSVSTPSVPSLSLFSRRKILSVKELTDDVVIFVRFGDGQEVAIKPVEYVACPHDLAKTKISVIQLGIRE